MKLQKGFTLLEVLIVLVIVAFLFGTAATRLNKTFRSESRAVQWRMASVAKYLYNTAASENKTARLTLDFESNSYWAEETSERFLIGMEKEGQQVNRSVGQQVGEAEDSGEPKDGEKKEAVVAPLEPAFGTMDSSLLEVKQFPSNVLLKDVYTSRSVEPVASGRAYIYFFPNGYMEEAIINFKDASDEKHLSIKFNSFNGEADVSNEYRKPK